MKRYGRSGWYGERHRHYLAAKGISTKRYNSRISGDAYSGRWVMIGDERDEIDQLMERERTRESRAELAKILRKREISAANARKRRAERKELQESQVKQAEEEKEILDDLYKDSPEKYADSVRAFDEHVRNNYTEDDFYAKKKQKEFIKGGKAEGRPASDFSKEQLKKGIKVEMEHTHDRRIAEEIAKDHLAEFPNYYDALEKMEMSLEKPKPGMAYPISPREAQKAIARMPEQSTKGLKGIEFVNPSGPQEEAWAQYTRGSKKVKVFAQPVVEIEERGPVVVHKHMMEYVIPHEVGHHRALRGGKTDKSLAVAEARADANVVGMDPFDKDVTARRKIRRQKGKKKRYNYTPTYVTGDLAPIAADGVGTAGAAVIPLIPLAVTAGAIYVGAKVVKKSYDKNKAEIAKQKKEAKRKNVKKKSSR